jgi:poly(hydroxyalkanoate) depolymerase family esterase
VLPSRYRDVNGPKSYSGRLDVIERLTANPGALSGSVYLSQRLPANAPLVVVLHGCTQQAVDYATAAGWLELSDRHGFMVLLPQQQRSNNANLCFNWFERGDIQRGMGEAASIKSMIDQVVQNYEIGAAGVFITGLSAGAAMAATMLACYPETFAGGGLIAGLPHGAASSVASALQQMRAGSRHSAEQLGQRVTESSDHDGPWPRISIWHGDTDRTVSAVNGNASLAQWLAVHGLESADATTRVDSHICHRTWRNDDGIVIVEHVNVGGMGHGTPIDLRLDDAVGNAAPFVLDKGIASSVHLLDFWGIGGSAGHEESLTWQRSPEPTLARCPNDVQQASPKVAQAETRVSKIINDALRSAGLLN